MLQWQTVKTMIHEAATEGFWERLADSRPYVAATARYLLMSGQHCGLYPMRHYDDSERDQHDIGAMRGIEVKSRSFDFRAFGDLTKRFASVIIDTCHHVEGNLRRFHSWPQSYWIWSQDMGAVLIVETEPTHRHWFRKWVKIRGRWTKVYCCPLMRGFRGPIMRRSSKDVGIPMHGVNLLTAEELADAMIRRRSAAEAALSSLLDSPWMGSDGLQSENPGVRG